MTIDSDKWINSLPNSKKTSDIKKYDLDHNIWVNTIHKTNNKNSYKKYTLTLSLCVIGLIFVSVIKNETRNLQKEINSLETSINKIKYDLHQSTLDYHVITSPENLAKLSKIYLETELIPYKKSQIKQLNPHNLSLARLSKLEEKTLINQGKDISKDVKLKIAKKIEKKKIELKKLQEIYSKPEELPKELKSQVASRIEKTKTELKNLYDDPKSVITSNRIQKWAGIQIVKAFFGLPVIPGK